MKTSPAVEVSETPIPAQSSLEHFAEHWNRGVHVVVDPHFRFFGTQAVQATCVLNEGSSPGNRKREEQGVETRVVEALADVSAGGEQEAFLAIGDRLEPHRRFSGPR